MPLDSNHHHPPVGKTQDPPKHVCSPDSPCEILLSDIGKRFHAFPKGTFRARFSPPAVPRSVLRYISAHPFTWTWTTKDGPNKGKSFSVPTVPTSCGEGSGRALRWVVSIFHSFKAHLNASALDANSGQVLRPIVRLYQNNMLVHFRGQALIKPSAMGKAATKAKDVPPTTPNPASPAISAEIAELRKEVLRLRNELRSLKRDLEARSPDPISPEIAPTVIPNIPARSFSPMSSISSIQSRTAHPEHHWLQLVLDHADCPPFLRHVDSGMTPILSYSQPDGVQQAVQVLFKRGPPVFLGFDSNGDLSVSRTLADPDLCDIALSINPEEHPIDVHMRLNP